MRRRWRWAALLALLGAGALSGCYYDPYTGWYYPYPPPPPYPYPYAGPPSYAPNGQPPAAPPPGNGSVTQTPLPPPP